MRIQNSILLGTVIAALALPGAAQTNVALRGSEGLPSTPSPQATSSPSSQLPTNAPAAPAPQSGPSGATSLTLKQAEQLSIKNNPQISM